MRTATTTILGREVTVRELTVGQALDYLESLGSGPGLPEMLKTLLELCVEGLSFEDCRSCRPSELRALYETFREANRDFFVGLRLLGLADPVETLVGTLTAEPRPSSDPSQTAAAASSGPVTQASTPTPSADS